MFVWRILFFKLQKLKKKKKEEKEEKEIKKNLYMFICDFNLKNQF